MSLSIIMMSIHPEDRERVRQQVNHALRTGERYESEYRVLQRDGTVKWIVARGQVEFDQDNRPKRFPGVIMDVTDSKRAKEQLARLTEEAQRRKRLYETILANTPDFAYVIGKDKRFVYANEPLLKMWGKPWDEAIGRTFLEIGYEKWHADMHESEVMKVIATKRSHRGEVPFNGTHGRRIYDYIFVPIIGEDGEVEAVAGTTRDVTERKQSELALAEADKKKDDFLALLAHELRNPLAPIRSGLQVMRLANGDAEVINTAREMMDRQLSHMVRLVDDLLDVSRITQNKMELRLTRIKLSSAIESAVEASESFVNQYGHQLTLDLPEQDIVLNADLTRLAQILLNLLTNACKYTPPGGQIVLRALLEDHFVVISVQDNGLGIPQSALPCIFDMFSQVDRSTERASGGLGIGLALVKGLVEKHGGTVSAESEEGRGSMFTVRLPVAEPLQKPADLRKNILEEASGSCRVLVVDDNRDGAATLALMLKLLGYEVSVAHDAAQAIASAEQWRPEVILMDIGLPHMNGLDATREILKTAWGCQMSIVALTGWGQESDREQSKQAGCKGHLVKPVDLTLLRQTLKAVTTR